MGEDFGVGKVGNERLEIGLGLDVGGKLFGGVAGGEEFLKGVIFGLNGGRLNPMHFLGRLGTNLLNDFLLLLLDVDFFDEDIDEVLDPHRIDEPPTVIGGLGGLGEFLGGRFRERRDESDKRRTAVALVRCLADDLTVEEDRCGETYGFLAHPSDRFVSLKGEGSTGDGEGLEGGLAHLAWVWVGKIRGGKCNR